MSDAPLIRPGEVAGWPKLVVRYPTEAACVAALLPPGLEPCGEPVVQLGVYCVPVQGRPEYGISTKVPARFDGTDGWYTLGIGIDQESAIFISRETNGQPKFPCSVSFFRLGDRVEAAAEHQGTTFFSFSGTVAGSREPDGEERADHEWWIKASRAVGGGPGFDYPPHVVEVRTAGVVTHAEVLDGAPVFAPSAWDPYTELLPMVGPATAELVTTRHTARSISVRGPLDAEAFAPYADTIGGSRWPGERGAPPVPTRGFVP